MITRRRYPISIEKTNASADTYEDEYEFDLISQSERVVKNLKYYIKKYHELKNELETLWNMYDSRVDAYLKLEERTKILEQQLALEMGCDSQ